MTKNTEHGLDVGGRRIRAVDHELTTTNIEPRTPPPFRGLENKRKGQITPAEAHPIPTRRPPQGHSQNPPANQGTQPYSGRQGNTCITGYNIANPYQPLATGSSSGSTSSQPHVSHGPGGVNSVNPRPVSGPQTTLAPTSGSPPREPNPWADPNSFVTVAPGLGRATTVPANGQYPGSGHSSTSTLGSGYGTTTVHGSGQGGGYSQRVTPLASSTDNGLAYENPWQDSSSSPSPGNLGRAATTPGRRMCRHGISGGSK